MSPDLSLPIEVAGEAIGIMATRGAGKSYTSAVLVEELQRAHVQVAVLDPTGVYWGLRAAATGQSGGLAIVVLGGAHGDVSLEPTAGKLIADLLVDTGQSLILDLSDFETKGAQTRFVADLAERLYTRKARQRTTLHLVIDEAHEFAPQKPMRDEPRMLGAMERLVGRGRSRGIGSTLITQRSATLNKNVLDLIDTLVAMRVGSPRDRGAVKDWIAAKDERDELGVLESLPGLPTGTAWVWSPVRGILKEVAIRRIRTFDSYATPKPGEKKAESRVLAPIDLGKLGEQITATKERFKAEDPKELQKRIRELEGELRTAKAPSPEKPVETVVEQVEVKVPILANGVVGKLEAVAAAIAVSSKELASVAETMVRELAPWREGPPAPPRPRIAPAPATQKVQVRASSFAPSSEARKSEVVRIGDTTLGKGEKTVLGVLRQWPEGRTYNELAFLAGYSARASTLGVILAKLRQAGYVEPGNQPVHLTPIGLETAGGYEPLPTGPTLLQHWLGHQRMGKGEREVLLVLVDQYPNALSHDELCEMAGYSPTASTMGVILSKLRKLGLVEKNARRLAPEFAETIQ